MFQAGVSLTSLVAVLIAGCWVVGLIHRALLNRKESGESRVGEEQVQQRAVVFGLPVIAWWTAYSVERESILASRGQLLTYAFAMAVIYLIIVFLTYTERDWQRQIGGAQTSPLRTTISARLWHPSVYGALDVYWLAVGVVAALDV